MKVADRPHVDVQPAGEPTDTDEGTDTLRADVEHWRDQAAERLDQARAWVRNNPLPALGIALAAGFLAGRMVRR